MLKKIVILIIITILFLSVPIRANNLEEFKVVAENKYLTLYLNVTTTEIAVKNKSNGYTWFSNPPEREKQEQILKGSAKEIIESQFSIEYYRPNFNRRSMNNISDSVNYNQFDIKYIDNGVRIDYTLGKKWDDNAYLPYILEKERTDDILFSTDKSLKTKIIDKYDLISLRKADSKYEIVDIYGIDTQEVFGKYRLIKHTNDSSGKHASEEIYEHFIDTIVENSNSKLEERADVTTEDILHFVDKSFYLLHDDIFPWDKNALIEDIKKISDHPVLVQESYLQFNFQPPAPNIRIFNIQMEYYLEKDNLVVRVPASEIEYPDHVLNNKGEIESYPLTRISLNKFFGAGNREETGYMFVPNGSGALIKLNNDKTYASPYSQRLYGRDYANKYRHEVFTDEKKARLPVYGIKKERNAFLAIIEDGKSLAQIKADIAGRTNSYNTVFPEFTLRSRAKIDREVSAFTRIGIPNRNASINMYQSVPYQDDIQIRYAFLADEDADYVGMAKYYRNYLEKRDIIERINQNQKKDIPLYLELVGGINVREPVWGVSQEIIKNLTSYNQVKEIISKLLENEIKNIELIYSGWLEGGINHIYPNHVNLESALGNNKDFNNLIQFLNKTNINFFPKVNFLNIYNSIFDGFNPRTHASRFLDRSIAIFNNKIDLATYQVTGEEKYLLSPGYLPNLIDKFLDDYQEYNFSGFFPEYFGDQLYSDNSREKVIYREVARNKNTNILKQIHEKGYKTMLKGGTDYLFSGTDNLVDIPLKSEDFRITDKSVPFYQIVLHGYINYAGSPLNLVQEKDYFLKSVEVGAFPHFKLIAEEGSIVKETDYNHLYSCNYKIWLDKLIDYYHQANSVLNRFQNQRIIDHGKLESGLWQTIYENKEAILVNYNNHSIKIGNREIPAKDFILIKEASTCEN